MSTNDRTQIDALLVEILRKPEDEREAFLDLVCRDDDNLRRELKGLLAASDEAADFLERPAVQVSETVLTPLREGPGTTIGRYKLLQRIGEGGFGVVYMAEQMEPVKRKVALKIIKLGMDTKQVIARFEAERQALAMMEHPNIARVLDAGATDTGRPYFVMELVRGVPITEYCDTENLSTRERLELFIQVCHAVQHAHQKGIIHRDIKPTNVMVTLHDGEPVPRIIDFGIAKATNRELTDKTLFTEFRQFLGTPAYMSPEQAEMSGLDIDTRSDIYSLGVLLYELLTGATPFDAEKLRKAAFGEIQRIIREVEPPKPSTRLSSLATETDPEPPALAGADLERGKTARAKARGSVQDIARNRRTDPSTLSKLIRGDLDWIVMKALEKNRTRRYETANEFAKDIEHHLTHEPILAGRPGVANKVRKFIKRNRVAVTAGSLVAAAIVIGLVVSTIGFVQASRQREQAVAARNEAEQARTAEAGQRALAESERDRATVAQQVAVREKQAAQRQAYVANIAAANAALSANETATVRQRLDAAPQEFRNWEWRYLHAQADDSLTILPGDDSFVWWNASYRPDGTLVAWGSDDNNVIRLWDASTGRELVAFRGHEDEVDSIRLSPDGTRVASASDDGTARLWDAYTGQELALMQLEGDGDKVAFSAGGTRLASASNDGTVRLWDAFTGGQLAVLRGREADFLSLALSPDGSRVAFASGWGSESDDSVHVWDASTGEELAVLGHEGMVHSVAFSPDGTRLASGSYDKTVRLWDASSGRELAILRGHARTVRRVGFSSDGTRLASGSEDSTVRLWDASTGKELAVLPGHRDNVLSVAFSQDGTQLASVSSDKTVRIWDASPNDEFRVLRGHERSVQRVVFSPDGTRLASASKGKTVRIWDASSGEELATLRGHDAEIWLIAFSPDGARLASSSQDSTVRLWDASTGEELVTLRGHEKGVGSAAFSPDGTRLAAGGRDKTVRIWDASSGEELATLRGHESWVRPAAFSPDGTRLASGGGDKTVRIWDASSGEQLRVLRGHTRGVRALAFSPDGTRLASGAGRWPSPAGEADHTVRLWDVATGQELAVLRGHQATVWDVAFSPDGTRLASAGDTTVRIWNTSTCEELATLRGHEGTVMSVAFSPDGTRLASASADKTVRIWDSVPYRIRYQERQAILAAQPEAERIVDDFWQKSHDWKSVAKCLHGDTKATEPLRRAALNLVLRQATGHLQID